MANRVALDQLSRFILDPIPQNSSQLVGIPCIYETLQYHESRHDAYPDSLISLCRWIWQRGKEVLTGLIVYPSPPVDLRANDANFEWKKVSTVRMIPPCQLK